MIIATFRQQRSYGSCPTVTHATSGAIQMPSLMLLSAAGRDPIYEQARSGQPLTIANSNGNLGNGQSSRANLVGNPHVSNPTPNGWFNPAAFAPAPAYVFGTANLGEVNGPGLLQYGYGAQQEGVCRRGKVF